MISERLYELAFQYKKAKLWKILEDADVFAVKLSGGRIGYISAIGASGQYCALALYIGEEGLDSFRAILGADRFSLSPYEFQEYLLMQDSLQCAFEGKDSLSQEEQEEAKQYARAHGIRISGRNAYPQFLKFKPFCSPWHLQTEQEQEDLCEALSAALEMARLLEGKKPFELGLQQINSQTEEVPMLGWKNGKYELKPTKLPKMKEREWPAPSVINDIAIANIKKMKKKGALECGLIRYPDVVLDEECEGGAPVYPLVFLAVGRDSGLLIPVPPVVHYEEHPEELLNLFMESLLEEDACPKEMLMQDHHSYAFAKEFCDRLKIKIRIEEDLPALTAAEYDFLERFGADEEEQMETVIRILNNILESAYKNQGEEVPEEFLSQLKAIVDQGLLPEELVERADQIFGLDTPKPSKIMEFEPRQRKAASKVSYVISVSLWPGCYRHIKISGGCTLLELHEAIQDAFAFDDDHAYAFFMDNTKWSSQDSYYAEELDERHRGVSRFRLEQIGLEKGKKFKYLFDFGDEWTFQCKVLRVLEEETDGAAVIKSVGDAPEQYPVWDDEEEDE